MITYRVLKLGKKYSYKYIYFGKANNTEELEEVYRLRYRVYVEKGYIDEAAYKDSSEKDDYDLHDKCHYFIAKIDDKIIGCIRLIVDNPLPTQKYFSFDEPEQISRLSIDSRCELGRFIIVPLNKDKGEYLPRNIIMLFLVDTLSFFGIKNNLLGGYSFIKKSLEHKLRKLHMPINTIDKYVQTYPRDGVLYNYFNQASDPVVPIYFLTKDFYLYSEKNIHNSFIFGTQDDKSLFMRENLYTEFLRKLKII